MARLLFISHPEVIIDPAVPVTRWTLSDLGIARVRQFARSAELANVSTIWSSRETKAVETAGLLAAGLGLGISVRPDLGENDRSATGFLPPDAFEQVADVFFKQPDVSVRGWERAIDAQDRIAGAVEGILAKHSEGDIAIVSHGAVGTLMLCHLWKCAIDRAHDQPGQGHYWAAELPGLSVIHGWKSISAGLEA